MKKKILIVSDSLRTGGIQSSLKAFLEHLPTNDFDIELFLFNKEGLEDAEMNKNIKVIVGNKFLQTVSCTSSYAKSMGVVSYLTRKFFALLCKIFSSAPMYKLVFLFQKPIKDIDIAIAYSNNVSNRSVYFGYNLFVLKKVVAKQKITYIHSLYSSFHSRYCDSEYEKFDKLWFVSNYAKQVFLSYHKGTKKPCYTIYNFVNINVGSNTPFKDTKKHLVTVGRIERQKSQIDSIEIANNLKKRGFDFQWYLVGDGIEKNKILDLIKKNGLESNIIITGEKKNATDYIKYADIYVSLSKEETFGLTVAEALALKTVVIYRNIPAIKEIADGHGIACNTNKEIANSIATLLSDKKYYQRTKNNSFFPLDNATIIETIEESIEK